MSSDEDVIEDDPELASKEQRERIENKRKRRREKSIDPKDYASDDEEMAGEPKYGRSMSTPKDR